MRNVVSALFHDRAGGIVFVGVPHDRAMLQGATAWLKDQIEVGCGQPASCGESATGRAASPFSFGDFQRCRAANCAISRRRCGVKAAALALPPLSPPFLADPVTGNSTAG